MPDRPGMLEENAPQTLGEGVVPFRCEDALSADSLEVDTDEDFTGPLIAIRADEGGHVSTIYLSMGDASRLRDWLSANIRRRNERLPNA